MDNENMTAQLQTVPKPGDSFGSAATFEHTQRVAKALAASDLVPTQFKNNIPNTIIALEMAGRLGASPLAVMQNLYVVQGKPGWASTFIIALVNSHPKYEDLNFERKGLGMDMECTAWAYRKGTKERVDGPTVTMKMAKSEGWLDKNGSKWKTMPELMIAYRSATFFGRLYTPELMLGMQSIEEVNDIGHSEVSIEEVRRLKEYERVTLMIAESTTVEQLESFLEHVAEDQMTAWKNRKTEIENESK